jgi:hypothetical protein
MGSMIELAAILEQLDAIRHEPKALVDVRFNVSQLEGSARFGGLQSEARDPKAHFESQRDFQLVLKALKEVREQLISFSKDLRVLRCAINDQSHVQESQARRDRGYSPGFADIDESQSRARGAPPTD